MYLWRSRDQDSRKDRNIDQGDCTDRRSDKEDHTVLLNKHLKHGLNFAS